MRRVAARQASIAASIAAACRSAVSRPAYRCSVPVSIRFGSPLRANQPGSSSVRRHTSRRHASIWSRGVAVHLSRSLRPPGRDRRRRRRGAAGSVPPLRSRHLVTPRALSGGGAPPWTPREARDVQAAAAGSGPKRDRARLGGRRRINTRRRGWCRCGARDRGLIPACAGFDAAGWGSPWRPHWPPDRTANRHRRQEGRSEAAAAAAMAGSKLRASPG